MHRATPTAGAKGLDVLLVGQCLPHSENLAIGYLLAALGRAGLQARAATLNSWTDLQPIVDEVSSLGPQVVGLSLHDGAISPLLLGLGEELRQSGYGGHITAGGAFATLARQWLLERYSWLDSVVRFAGEVPLVELARGLRHGVEVDGAVAGLTTRSGDGLPAPVLDPSRQEFEPERGELPEILGYRIAQISATRGCRGRCAYCGPAALQQLERAEGARAAMSEAELVAAGVGGIRRRSVESIADEMATLWHQHRARYFCFIDEQLLPEQERAALEFVEQWRHALSRRYLRRPPLSCMVRADRLSPRIMDALVDLGLARCLVGMELLSRQELRQYGRGGQPDESIERLRQLEERGVATVCNVMLVHPHSTEQTIERGLGVLESMVDLPYEVARMQVYHGTTLHAELSRQGRIVGNPLWYEYSLADPVAQRFALIESRLGGGWLGQQRLSSHLRDVRLALNLAERFHPGVSVAGLKQAARQAVRRANELHTWMRRQALSLARVRRDVSVDALVEQVAGRTAGELAELDRIWHELLERVPWRGPLFSPAAAAAAAAITYVMLSGAAACAPASPSLPQPAPPGPVADVGPAESAGAGAPAEPPAAPWAGEGHGPTEQGPGPPAGARPGGSASGVHEELAWAEYPGMLWPSQETGIAFVKEPLPACPSPAVGELARDKVQAIVRKLANCSSVNVVLDSLQGRVMLLHTGAVAGSHESNHWYGGVEVGVGHGAPRALVPVARAIASGLNRPELGCLADSGAGVDVPGKEAADLGRLVTRLDARCKTKSPPRQATDLRIRIDPGGAVTDVRPPGGSKAAAAQLQCVRIALRGLRFPCLAEQEIAVSHATQVRRFSGGDFF